MERNTKTVVDPNHSAFEIVTGETTEGIEWQIMGSGEDIYQAKRNLAATLEEVEKSTGRLFLKSSRIVNRQNS